MGLQKRDFEKQKKDFLLNYLGGTKKIGKVAYACLITGMCAYLILIILWQNSELIRDIGGVDNVLVEAAIGLGLMLVTSQNMDRMMEDFEKAINEDTRLSCWWAIVHFSSMIIGILAMVLVIFSLISAVLFTISVYSGVNVGEYISSSNPMYTFIIFATSALPYLYSKGAEKQKKK